MSRLNLSSIGCALVFAVIFGWCSDKIKSWKILTFLGILTVLFALGFLSDVVANREKRDHIGPLFDICLPLFFGFHVSQLMIGNVYLAKVCNPQSRGTIFSLAGLVEKIAGMLAVGAAGYLYSNVGETWAFALMVVLFAP